jgi:hypothetical protein
MVSEIEKWLLITTPSLYYCMRAIKPVGPQMDMDPSLSINNLTSTDFQGLIRSNVKNGGYAPKGNWTGHVDRLLLEENELLSLSPFGFLQVSPVEFLF